MSGSAIRRPCSEDCVCIRPDDGVFGPEAWAAFVCDDGYPAVSTACGGDMVCHDDGNHHPGCQLSLARFRLIAAAPDLLKACEALVDDWHAHGGSALSSARAAIAKAKGLP